MISQYNRHQKLRKMIASESRHSRQAITQDLVWHHDREAKSKHIDQFARHTLGGEVTPFSFFDGPTNFTSSESLPITTYLSKISKRRIYKWTRLPTVTRFLYSHQVNLLLWGPTPIPRETSQVGIPLGNDFHFGLRISRFHPDD